MPKHLRPALLLILLCQLVIAFTLTMTPVFGSWIEQHFETSKKLLGLLFSIGSAGGAVAGLLGGWLSDRLGMRRVLAAGLCVAALGFGLCGLLRHLSTFAGGLSIAGFGVAAFLVCAAAYLCASYPENRRRMMGALQLAAAVGYCAAPLAVDRLLHLVSGDPSRGHLYFHTPFVVAAAFLALAAALVWLRMPEPAPAAQTQALSPTGAEAVPWASMGLIVLLAALHSGEGMMSLWFVRYCDERFAPVSFPPARGLAAYGAAFILGRGMLTVFGERHGNYRWLVVPGLAGGGLFVAAALASGQMAATAAFVGAGVFISIEYPALNALAAGAWPGRSGTLLGALGVSNTVGVIAGCSLIGALADTGVPLSTALLLPGLCILGFGAVAGLWALRERIARRGVGPA